MKQHSIRSIKGIRVPGLIVLEPAFSESVFSTIDNDVIAQPAEQMVSEVDVPSCAEPTGLSERSMHSEVGTPSRVALEEQSVVPRTIAFETFELDGPRES